MSENWDFFFCHVENQPASIFVNLGIREEAPIAGLEQLVWLRVPLLHPTEDGLIDDNEQEKLSDLEDALESAIGEQSEIMQYVGRITTGGNRDFFIYTANLLATESTLSTALVPFSEYEVEVDTKDDPDWSAYVEFLYPNEREMQMIQNGRVISQLEEHGDQLEVPREVCHWIYFPSTEDRAGYLSAAEELGYRPTNISHDEEADSNPYGLTLARDDAVDFVSINNVVLELFDLAQEYNGNYDGWETPIVKPDGD